MEQKPYLGFKPNQAFDYNYELDQLLVRDPDGTIWLVDLSRPPSEQVMVKVA